MSKSLEQQYRDDGIKLGLAGEDQVPLTTQIADAVFWVDDSCKQAREEGIQQGLSARVIAQAING